ncbi:MAG: hypothetical protein FWH03_07730 [Firmicutes bacterium]|nr:hypothetical protein [Bacillota bacterium]
MENGELRSDLFSNKKLTPMLLSKSAPFDHKDFIFEFKYDGARALLYVSESHFTAMSRNQNDLTALFPEFDALRGCVRGKCILDGEIYCTTDGIPDFKKYLKRGNILSPFKAKATAAKYPMQYAAFDILYLNGKDLTACPLMQRKEILRDNVTPCGTLSIVDYIETHGIRLFETAKQNGLEGVVAKRKTAPYFFGRRSKDWFKVKC